MTETPTLPEEISIDRLPDDVTVIRTSRGFGAQRNIHLFADCKHAADAASTHTTTLGHVGRDSICKRCSGNEENISNPDPWESRKRLEHKLEPRHIPGLTPMPKHRQTEGLDADKDPEADRDSGAEAAEVIAGD